MRRLSLFLLAAAFGIAGCESGARGAQRSLLQQAPFQVKVIALNDYHGNLQSPGSFGTSTAGAPAQRPAVGGAEVIAGHVAKLKNQNPNHVVVGAGDLIGASPLISALFFDEPSVETLNRMGLEFSAVGNHEFDKGFAELLRLQNGGCKQTGGAHDPNSCKGAAVGTPVPFEGAKFKWLSANVVTAATGQPLLPAYGVKRFNGVDIAFIGMTLRATPTIVSPSGVEGLAFRDEAATVNALVPTLKARGIEAIVVLLHEGGTQTGSLADINQCVGQLAGSPLAEIVAQLDDAVDLVTSGHTHSAYTCRLPNARGRPIPVTSASAFGRVLTDIDLTIDPATKDVTAAAATNRLVDRSDASVTPVTAVQAIVSGYERLAAPLAAQVVGSIAGELSAGAVDAACNMPAGEFIADAQLAATAPAGSGNAVIAFMNRGGVRHPGFTFAQSGSEGDGNVTYGEAFTAQPFGNSLVTMTLTAQDIKNVLEQQFAGCRGQSAAATRIMLPSKGFKYTWDAAAVCDARVRNVTLVSGASAGPGAEILVDANGRVIDPTRPYRVTVNHYMASGGDGFSTFVNGTDRLAGAQDIDALVSYFGRYKAPAAPHVRGNDTEDAGSPRLRRSGGTGCRSGAALGP